MWESRMVINIQGQTYRPMDIVRYNRCYSIFDIICHLEPMEYAPYFDKYIIKTKDNKYKALYKNDFNNIWEI